MIGFDGKVKPNEYDIISGGIIGNANFIKERYPQDKIMHQKLQYLTDYVLRLGYLMGKDYDAALQFSSDIKKGRYG